MPRKIAKAPAADQTQIIAGAAVDEKFWLFLNSSTAVPCALDAHSGTVATFEIPGRTILGSHAPNIQSCDIVAHAQAALLLVAGGDRTAWRFWMEIGSMAYSPSGNVLAVGTSQVSLWEPTTAKKLGQLPEWAGGAACLAFSPDGKKLATGRGDSTVLVWDVTAFTGLAEKKP